MPCHQQLYARPPYVDAKRVTTAWRLGGRFRRADEWKHPSPGPTVHEPRFRPARTAPPWNSSTDWWTAAAFIERWLLLDDSNVYGWAALSRYHNWLRNESVSLHASQKAIEAGPDTQRPSRSDPASLRKYREPGGGVATDRGPRELAPNDWLSGIKAFVLLYLDALSEAAELING